MRLLKLSLITLSVISFQSLNSQTNSVVIENNVSAIVNDRGALFHNYAVDYAGYELPIGGGNHLIYQGAFWFGGLNQNGDLKLAAQMFGSNYDYYRGPYSSTGSYTDSLYLSEYAATVWKVKESEIIYHLDNFNQSNYVTPSGILNWPGNGDPTLGVAAQLAPYVDVNNNGIYEPHLGEYPCIKGDEAAYQIMHEDSIHNRSGGERIGAEIHIMVYLFYATDYINNTTFIETTVYNRGGNSFSKFNTSFYLDADIGYNGDDYVGSFPNRNLVYTYNATNYDAGQAGSPGYGEKPPAVGVVSLNKTVDYSGMFYGIDALISHTSYPSSTSDFWNYMNGKWRDGSEWTIGGLGHGGSIGTTQHMFDGNPNLEAGWTELNNNGVGPFNQAGDRHLVITSVEDDFLPGDKLTFDYAVIMNRNRYTYDNVDGVIAYASFVQNFYDSLSTSCLREGTGVTSVNDEYELDQLNLYPNPATNQVKIVWNEMNVEEIKITSFQGKLIKRVSANGSKGEKIIDINGLSPGIYFVNVGKTVRKLIVN